jgi:hypothetical protein
MFIIKIKETCEPAKRDINEFANRKYLCKTLDTNPINGLQNYSNERKHQKINSKPKTYDTIQYGNNVVPYESNQEEIRRKKFFKNRQKN